MELLSDEEEEEEEEEEKGSGGGEKAESEIEKFHSDGTCNTHKATRQEDRKTSKEGGGGVGMSGWGRGKGGERPNNKVYIIYILCISTCGAGLDPFFIYLFFIYFYFYYFFGGVCVFM